MFFFFPCVFFFSDYNNPIIRSWFCQRRDFFWTDDELDLLVRCALVFKSKCEYEGLSWEGTKAKHDKIKELVVERYPNKPSDNPKEKLPRIGKTELITKERISSKPKEDEEKLQKNLWTVEEGELSLPFMISASLSGGGGGGRGGSPAVESVDTGIDSSSASV